MSPSTFEAAFSSWLGTEAHDSLHSEGSCSFSLTTCPNSEPGIWESLPSATVCTCSLLLSAIAGDTRVATFPYLRFLFLSRMDCLVLFAGGDETLLAGGFLDGTGSERSRNWSCLTDPCVH